MTHERPSLSTAEAHSVTPADTSDLTDWFKKHGTTLESSRETLCYPRVAAQSLAIWSILSMGTTLATGIEDHAELINEATSALSAKHELNYQMSAIASDLAGSPILVNCDDEPLNRLDEQYHNSDNGRMYSTEGLVRRIYLPDGTSFSPPLTTVREGLCETIVHYDPTLPSDPNDTEAYDALYEQTARYTWSTYVLLHETEHTNEVHDEAAASCYAIQKLPEALEKQGVDEMYTEFMPYALAHDLARSSKTAYLSDECRPDGALDLAISDVYIIKPEYMPELFEPFSFGPRPLDQLKPLEP